MTQPPSAVTPTTTHALLSPRTSGVWPTGVAKDKADAPMVPVSLLTRGVGGASPEEPTAPHTSKRTPSFVPLAYPDFRWVILGPLLILGLMLGVSVPLMERHLIARHPNYGEYQRHMVSPVFPWFARAQNEPLQRVGEGVRL